MNITRAKLKETLRTIVNEESEYQTFFKTALEKAGKSIPEMSEEEKKAFFNKIDAAWDAKGEKNEALKGDQHKLDVDGDGEIEASDLAALRAGKKANESVNEGKKRFYQQDRVGSAKYTISYHDGKQKHKDGSDFYGIQTFKNKQDLEKFRAALLKKGYREDSGFKKESVNEYNVNKKFGSKYDIGAGQFPTGTVFWNRAEDEDGDYKKLAHIADNGKITFYDKSLPSNVKKHIEDYAKTQTESVNEIRKGSVVIPYAMDKYGEFIVDKVFKNKSGETSYTGKFKKSGETREFILHSKDKVVKESITEEKTQKDLAKEINKKFGGTYRIQGYNLNIKGANASAETIKDFIEDLNKKHNLGYKRFFVKDKGSRKILGSVPFGIAITIDESVNEAKDDFVARYGKSNILLKKGYKHHTTDELEALYDKVGKLVKGLNVKDVNVVFESEVTEGKKVFKVNPGIGKAKYSISSHDGKKTHKDGSDFYDIEIFNNKVDLEKGIKKYTSNGFVKESVNENFAKFDTLKMAVNQHEKGAPYYDKTRLINIFNQLSSSDQVKAKKQYSGYFGESVNEAPDAKKRFMFDFYNDSFQKNTERETNFLATTLESAIKAAENICKVTGYGYVEIYYKDLFLGSMKKQNGFKFVEGRGYSKFKSIN